MYMCVYVQTQLRVPNAHNIPMWLCRDEIAYLMECADTNNDGLLDYMEFTERFHQPAENIGRISHTH